MTPNDTCPHCGAEQDTFHSNLYYLCGSIKGMPEHRTLKCFKTQVAHQAAEIERLKQAVLDEPELGSNDPDAHLVGMPEFVNEVAQFADYGVAA